MAWQAESVQTVFFTAPGRPQPSARKVYELLTGGEEPDNSQKTGTAPAISTLAAGDFGGLSYGIQSQLGRLDIFLREPDDGTGTLSLLKDVDDKIKLSSQFFELLAGEIEPIRLAMVTSLAEQLNGNNIFDIFKQYLPEITFPNGSSEPIYQFNHKRTFDFDNRIIMNRICSYSSGTMQLMTLNPGLGTSIVHNFPMFAFKIDVNSGSQVRMDKSISATIINELIKETIAIKELGMGRFE